MATAAVKDELIQLAPDNENSESEPETGEPVDDSWRQEISLSEGSQDEASSQHEDDSGEDSEEGGGGGADTHRHQQDMDLYKRRQQRAAAKAKARSSGQDDASAASTPSENVPSPDDETEEDLYAWITYINKDTAASLRSVYSHPVTSLQECRKLCRRLGYSAFVIHEHKAYFRAESANQCKDNMVDAVGCTLHLCFDSPEAAAVAHTTGSPNVQGKNFRSFVSRLSRFGSSSPKTGQVEVIGGASMLKENIDGRNNEWYRGNLASLARDGICCTKVGTNGRPYDRRVHIDVKNLHVEIRGGRSGVCGILLDELIDLRKGFASSEFTAFVCRLKRAAPTELSERCLVLRTPSRTFSLLFVSSATRTVVGHTILFLLREKNRGVMASGPSVALTNIPKSGHGSVTYPNRSAYVGNFQNHMRNGHGVLTLSDGTKYDSDWRNDERHGKGKEMCPDGTLFVGSYTKGMRHGHGVMTWPEGSKYSGQFERGRANGDGELLRTDGSIYKGAFAEDCMSGAGVMKWRDGVEYVGQFVANRREGYGIMHWTSGRWKSYDGHWKDGLQHHRGTLRDQEGNSYLGVFKAGKLDHWVDD